MGNTSTSLIIFRRSYGLVSGLVGSQRSLSCKNGVVFPWSRIPVLAFGHHRPDALIKLGLGWLRSGGQGVRA